MIVRAQLPNMDRFAVLECECGVVTWIGAFLKSASCRRCHRRWTSGPGARTRLAAARAVIRLRFPGGVADLTSLRNIQDLDVAEVTRDVFCLLRGMT